MEQFYTKKISDKVCKALHEVNFPFPIADMGFTVPQIVEMPVDYASVLDWLKSKSIEITLDYCIGAQNDTWIADVYKRNMNLEENTCENTDWFKCLDEAILCAIGFLKQEKMTYNEFVEDVLDRIKECPTNWRKGQSVFNVIDDTYGVARRVQFEDHVDCFYNDDKIDEFMQKAYNKLCE